MNRLNLIFIALLVVSVSCGAAGFRELRGTMLISGASPVDPPPGEAKDRVLFNVSGPAAREMYDSISVRPHKDLCDDTSMTKSSGALECTRSSGGKYFCTFGLLLKSGEAVQGRVC